MASGCADQEVGSGGRGGDCGAARRICGALRQQAPATMKVPDAMVVMGSPTMPTPEQGLADQPEPVPNPEVRQHEEAQRLAKQHEEADTGRHGIDQSRPTSYVRKSH